MKTLTANFAVVGGGVAGVCCAEELETIIETQEYEITEFLNNSYDILIVLICGVSGFVKVITNVEKLGQITESFKIKQKLAQKIKTNNISVIQDDVCKWNSAQKELFLKNNKNLKICYNKLCIATGSIPKRTLENAIIIKDTDSIKQLHLKLLNKLRRVVLVGNGGIATELIFELKNIEEIYWIFPHSTISATYFDEAAAKFFEDKLLAGRSSEKDKKFEVKQHRYTVYSEFKNLTKKTCDIYNDNNQKNKIDPLETKNYGCSLGPHWLSKLKQTKLSEKKQRKVQIICNATVKTILNSYNNVTQSNSTNENWPFYVTLNNNMEIGCDLVIEATGVIPNSEIWSTNSSELKIAEDNGILINDFMQTSIPDVFAAGDVCTLDKKFEKSHWTQIRLWTQARQMGVFCAQSMAIKNVMPPLFFEMFSHVTTFFGYKVILLGDFSASKLEKPYEICYRIGNNVNPKLKNLNKNEYIKIIYKNSTIHGAVLIGETDLEETFENLILNQTDVSQIKEILLNPNVDLEEYFD